MNRKLIGLGLMASFAGPISDIAGPFTDFEHDLRDAYGQYRTALFQSNQGNAEATAKALQSLSDKWAMLEQT